MGPGPEQLEDRLAAARAGSREALGQVLSRCWGYLLHIARRELGRDLQPKTGASDLVQEAFLEAQQGFDRFEGQSDGDLRAWLRCLLLHQAAKVGRCFRATQKRRLGREVYLGAIPYRTAPGRTGPADPAPRDPGPSPSAHLLARERQELLLRAIDRLPDDQRRVLVLRYQRELTFEEIGRLMQRSGDAARMLWGRALERLKHELRPFC